MWNNAIVLFREYMGTGLIVGWFLLSAAYLLLKEKRKHIRILFLYVPIILLLLFFNPLFADIVYGVVGDEIYYRILWLIPITVVIAYGTVQLYGSLKGRARIVWAGIAAVLVVISGSYIYGNPYFRRAENLYHVPQAVVSICDAIEIEGREVMAVFPAELLQYVRQYSPVVCMPYGRELTVDRWNHQSELYDCMEAEIIDAGQLAARAREEQCHYIVLPEEKEIKGSLTDWEYVFFGNMDGYDVYQDPTQDFTSYGAE